MTSNQGANVMKIFPLLLSLILAESFAAPSIAKEQMSKGLQSQTKPLAQGNLKSAAQGPVSDIPMDQPGCKKAGGSWNDQTLTCNRKGKL
jgi:hypothetical protein